MSSSRLLLLVFGLSFGQSPLMAAINPLSTVNNLTVLRDCSLLAGSGTDPYGDLENPPSNPGKQYPTSPNRREPSAEKNSNKQQTYGK
jgi:hypothetical protein